MTVHVLRRAILVVALVGSGGAAALAQDAPQGPPPARPQGGPGPGQAEGRLPGNPAEVGKLFDAYAMVQAQEALALTDDQFGRFVARFKMLLDQRRRQVQGRMRLMTQLVRLTQAAVPDEAALREHLRALDEHEASSLLEVRTASDAVTATLTLLQQARFRLFEEQMERRKLDLMTRARQGARRNQRLP